VLVDHARKRQAAKRGGSAVAVSLRESRTSGQSLDADIVALDQALSDLEALDARQCKVVELRYFGGLKHEEIAAALQVSLATVNRDWRSAKLWLHRALANRGDADER